ncbi:MAG: hypothetical protein CM1200mP20_13210 [Pseudomonadota bacterium]|nr:MAG: hypothetical protein CM1200mP20_13210 [Pseudomonadota bacterium]
MILLIGRRGQAVDGCRVGKTFVLRCERRGRNMAIMKPESSPARGVRKGGNALMLESISIATRRSARAPVSAMASAYCQHHGNGLGVKIPPRHTSPVWRQISGLSETELASRSSTRAAWPSCSRQAPSTWG